MLEVATFQPDDRAELVGASLACRRCLHGEVDWALDGDAYDPSALCTCRACGYVRRVYLSSEQALRLALHPPH